MEWSLRSGWKTIDGNLAKHVSLLQVLHAADGSVLRKQADLPDEDGVGGGAILVPGPDPSPCEVTGESGEFFPSVLLFVVGCLFRICRKF